MTSTLSRPVRLPAPSDLQVWADPARGSIRVRGELDRANAHQLDGAVAVLRGASTALWSIDAAEVTFCDAVGLRALLRAQQSAAQAGCRLEIVRPGRMLARLLALVGPDGGSPTVRHGRS